MLLGAATNASVLTILAMAYERYVAVCHPLKMRTVVDYYTSRVRETFSTKRKENSQYLRRRICVCIVLVWLVAISASSIKNSQYRFTILRDNICNELVPPLGNCDIDDKV